MDIPASGPPVLVLRLWAGAGDNRGHAGGFRELRHHCLEVGLTNGYRREKLHPEPSRIKGFRTIKAGSHRVRIALLPGGGSVAVALLHPKGEEKRNPYCPVGQWAKKKNWGG